jgi:transketolase
MQGLRGYGATFLIFSDYMKASIRLAALMHVPSVFVFTHDSIGLGEDGPTHQPIEQLAGLRAIPNLHVIRPADSNEMARAWQHALKQDRTPSAFALSRQNVPTLDPAKVPADCIERGAYVLEEASSGEPEVILIATGTEVHIAAEARQRLEDDGVPTRLVSMPCMDTFAEQDKTYIDEVLPPDVGARVSVEAAGPFGWHRWVGDRGATVAMNGFGASGPYQELYEYFGFTPETIAERAKAALGAERSGTR